MANAAPSKDVSQQNAAKYEVEYDPSLKHLFEDDPDEEYEPPFK